jgi:hypothetical protein
MSITIDQLRELTALQAEDACLWDHAPTIGEAYTQQALRYLTRAIDGEWTFEQAKEAIREMMPWFSCFHQALSVGTNGSHGGLSICGRLKATTLAAPANTLGSKRLIVAASSIAGFTDADPARPNSMPARPTPSALWGGNFGGDLGFIVRSRRT